MLYQLSYLGTIRGKKSEALLQDRWTKIKSLPISPVQVPTEQVVAEREGFEPSVRVLPLRQFSKLLPSAARPPLHLFQPYAGFLIMCGVVDDRRITSNRGVILPQALWEVQAIREAEQQKILGEAARVQASTCLFH